MRTFKKLRASSNRDEISKLSKNLNPSHCNYQSDACSCASGCLSGNRSVYSNSIYTGSSVSSKVTKLVCPDCVNRETAERKRAERNEKAKADKEKVPGCFGNNYKDEEIIRNKIRNREELTKRAADDVKNYQDRKRNKEVLQNNNEKESFFDNAKDYNKLRAENKAKDLDKILSRNFSNYNNTPYQQQVQNYYNKCVGSGNESIIKPRGNKYDKQEYYNDALQQIDNIQKLRNKRNLKEKDEDQKIIKENIDKFDKEYNDNMAKHKMDQRNMDDTNRRLIKLKEQREREQKQKDLEEEKDILDNIKKRNQQEREKNNKLKQERNQIYQENYQNFLRNKNDKKEKEEMDKDNDRQLEGMCFHGSEMGTCEVCHKEVPARALTSLRVPKHKNNKKTSNY